MSEYRDALAAAQHRIATLKDALTEKETALEQERAALREAESELGQLRRAPTSETFRNAQSSSGPAVVAALIASVLVSLGAMIAVARPAPSQASQVLPPLLPTAQKHHVVDIERAPIDREGVVVMFEADSVDEASRDRVAVLAKAGALHASACFDGAVPAGQLLHWTVDGDGAVSQVRPSPAVDETTARCIDKQLRAAERITFDGPRMTVTTLLSTPSIAKSSAKR